MGDLPSVYQCADIVIMGGSFSPDIGGHNFLEPLFFGRPVIAGPCMQNFHELDHSFAAEGGILKVDGPEGLASALEDLMSNADRRRAIGAKGRELLLASRGGSEETYAAIFGPLGVMDRFG